MRGDIQLAGRRWNLGPSRFGMPLRVLQTADPAAVADTIAEAEQAAMEGHWVAGYISYQAANGLYPRLCVPGHASVPLVWLAVYAARNELPPTGSEHTYSVGEWTPGMSKQEHSRRVTSIKDAISQGISYQVNLTFPSSAKFTGSTNGLFTDMLAAQPTSYAAHIDAGDFQVLSVSPELYLSTVGRTVQTKPMKGTAPRGRHPSEDLAHARDLRNSEKEQASNVMVVDLLRNDLGRIAEQGTVNVPALFETERHPTVWQLTSTIEAQLRDGVGVVDLLTATFPSGSVTGAPKVSTMELIAEHETAPRDVYCGAIGYIAPGWETSEFSVAIRTGVVRDGSFTYHSGGGITADSESSAEYEECLWKTRVVTKKRQVPDLIETMAYLPGEGIALLGRHLNRLAGSAALWGIPFDLNRIQRSLYRIDLAHSATVRLVLRWDGSVEVRSRPLPAVDEPVRLVMSETVVDPEDALWFHKTDDRSRYPHTENGTEAVLTNVEGEVTETNISNIMARFAETWTTPPMSSGCLPGVFRSKMLDDGLVVERPMTIDELGEAEELAVTNAVRGWRKAVLAD